MRALRAVAATALALLLLASTACAQERRRGGGYHDAKEARDEAKQLAALVSRASGRPPHRGGLADRAVFEPLF